MADLGAARRDALVRGAIHRRRVEQNLRRRQDGQTGTSRSPMSGIAGHAILLR